MSNYTSQSDNALQEAIHCFQSAVDALALLEALIERWVNRIDRMEPAV